MHRHTITLVGLVGSLALGGSVAGAQDQPSPEMQKLAFLVGKWTADTGVRETVWIAAGKFLRMESHLKDVPGIGGVNLVGYDPEAKVYRVWAFNVGREDGRPTELKGQLEGDQLVVSNAPLMAYLKAHPPLMTSLGGYRADSKRTEQGYFRVQLVIPKSPEAKAGIQVGDVITKIDGRSVVGASLNALERGKVGSTAHVTLLRGGQEREVSVVRQPTLVATRVHFEPKSTSEYIQWSETKIGDRFEKSGEVTWKASP